VRDNASHTRTLTASRPHHDPYHHDWRHHQ
jgi:hypothetical protein